MRKLILTSVLSVMGICFSPLHGDDPAENHERKEHVQYGSFFTRHEVLVRPEHPIIFDHHTVRPTRGIEHPEGTGDFILKEPGVYEVTYSASLKCSGGYLAVTLDDVVIPGSEMYVGAPYQLSTLSFVIKVCGEPNCCNHVLRVINNYPLTPGWFSHDLHLHAGGYDTVTAAIEIEKIAKCCKKCPCKDKDSK